MAGSADGKAASEAVIEALKPLEAALRSGNLPNPTRSGRCCCGPSPAMAPAEPDVSLHDPRAGDRYLLCSDGLTTVVGAGAIRNSLSAPGDPEQVVDRVIDPANQAGGPDNIACVVADVIESRS